MQNDLVDPVGAEGIPHEDLPPNASLFLIGGTTRRGLFGHNVLSQPGLISMIPEDSAHRRSGTRRIHGLNREAGEGAMEFEQLRQLTHGEQGKVRTFWPVDV